MIANCSDLRSGGLGSVPYPLSSPAQGWHIEPVVRRHSGAFHVLPITAHHPTLEAWENSVAGSGSSSGLGASLSGPQPRNQPHRLSCRRRSR